MRLDRRLGQRTNAGRSDRGNVPGVLIARHHHGGRRSPDHRVSNYRGGRHWMMLAETVAQGNQGGWSRGRNSNKAQNGRFEQTLNSYEARAGSPVTLFVSFVSFFLDQSKLYRAASGHQEPLHWRKARNSIQGCGRAMKADMYRSCITNVRIPARAIGGNELRPAAPRPRLTLNAATRAATAAGRLRTRRRRKTLSGRGGHPWRATRRKRAAAGGTLDRFPPTGLGNR